MLAPFLEFKEKPFLVADGAMGSLLYERGIFINRHFEALNLQEPTLIQKIHQDYLDAGADILETNTYGANRLRLQKHGLENQTAAINIAGVKLAKQVAAAQAYVAGSMGPSGLYSLPDTGEIPSTTTPITAAALSAAFSEQADLLGTAGVDVLILETFTNLQELQIALQAVRAVAPKIPLIAQVSPLLFHKNPALTANALATTLRTLGVDMLGLNCGAPEILFPLAEALQQTGLLLAVMPNAGAPQHIEDRLLYLATPENFGVFARRFYQLGVKIVGGCCGTNPAYIREIAKAAKMAQAKFTTPKSRLPQTTESQSPASPSQISVTTTAAAKTPLPLDQRSALGAKLGKQFIISVEINPAPGLSSEPSIDAATMLLEHGVDIINIADGPRATLRMSNLALAIKMQERLQREVLLHVCTRDHNLLGIQSLVLGAHVLGIKNLVIISGDPPKIGNYPESTPVYDVDSVGLLKILNNYNHGLDLAGKEMEQTSFVLASGTEPQAQDLDREIRRLEQKVAAGADFIMTQPVYDLQLLERFLQAVKHLSVPLLIGILPLASYKNAEFLHNHVPGMRIPESTRERLRRAPTGAAARQEGVKIAAEMLAMVRETAAGAYIMPALNHYEMIVELLATLPSDRTL